MHVRIEEPKTKRQLTKIGKHITTQRSKSERML